MKHNIHKCCMVGGSQKGKKRVSAGNVSGKISGKKALEEIYQRNYQNKVAFLLRYLQE